MSEAEQDQPQELELTLEQLVEVAGGVGGGQAKITGPLPKPVRTPSPSTNPTSAIRRNFSDF